MLTYPWKCTVLHRNHLREGDNQSVRSSAPVVSRCFPGGYDVKLYIFRGRLAWWLLAFLHSVRSEDLWSLCLSLYVFIVHIACTVSLADQNLIYHCLLLLTNSTLCKILFSFIPIIDIIPSTWFGGCMISGWYHERLIFFHLHGNCYQLIYLWSCDHILCNAFGMNMIDKTSMTCQLNDFFVLFCFKWMFGAN